MQKTKRFYHYFVKSSNISKFNTFGGRRAILFAPMVVHNITLAPTSPVKGKFNKKKYKNCIIFYGA
jgi:hypothetical protein